MEEGEEEVPGAAAGERGQRAGGPDRPGEGPERGLKLGRWSGLRTLQRDSPGQIGAQTRTAMSKKNAVHGQDLKPLTPEMCSQHLRRCCAQATGGHGR